MQMTDDGGGAGGVVDVEGRDDGRADPDGGHAPAQNARDRGEHAAAVAPSTRHTYGSSSTSGRDLATATTTRVPEPPASALASGLGA
jgi:hypothetical protein